MSTTTLMDTPATEQPAASNGYVNDDTPIAVQSNGTNGTNGVSKKVDKKASRPRDIWFYPADIENDLKSVDLPERVIGETLACAWEYTRCVIPHFTNWKRYIAFARIIEIGIIAEFRGGLVDVSAGNSLLGFELDELLDIVFGGTPGGEDMAREYRAFLLITGDKCSNRRDSELFRRYVNALAQSPKTWFRMRDCDALVRFTIAAALRCNDFNDIWFNEEELQILAELGDTLYDAVAFHKHRAEGETNSTFAYVDDSLRKESFRRAREVLWALDVAWAHSPAHRCVIDFIRPFGGPIHMMMRRYRFVEDGLTIGNSETEDVVVATRSNFKLWNRIDSNAKYVEDARYTEVLAQSDRLMFPGLVDLLENANKGQCHYCHYRLSYGAQASGQFGGVKLCDRAKEEWCQYVEDFPSRAAEVFPEIKAQWRTIGSAAATA